MSKELAKKCQSAVFRQVEDDRCLNAENIALAIEKEIAVEGPQQSGLQLNKLPPIGATSHLVHVVTRSQLLVEALRRLNPGGLSTNVVNATRDLQQAIKDAGF